MKPVTMRTCMKCHLKLRVVQPNSKRMMNNVAWVGSGLAHVGEGFTIGRRTLFVCTVCLWTRR